MKNSDQQANGSAMKKDYLSMFKKSVLDQARSYPDPEPVINLVQDNETFPILTLRSFSLWHGKKKSRKTTVIAMAIAAYISALKTKDEIRFEGVGEAGKVIFIDTEQGLSYAAKTMSLILKLAGLEKSDRLIYCDFREFEPSDRKMMLESALEDDKSIRIVVIDGIVDLMDDFQEPKEAHKVIWSLLKLCSKHNIHIAGILHQNKIDKNPRAHIGTISTQRCEIEISCEKYVKDPTQSIVRCEDIRGKLPFKPFAIKWEKGSLPYIVQDAEEFVSDKNRSPEFDVRNLPLSDHLLFLHSIFSADEELNDRQLKDALKGKAAVVGVEKISEATARVFVKVWQDQKLIVCRAGPRNSKLFRLCDTD